MARLAGEQIVDPFWFRLPARIVNFRAVAGGPIPVDEFGIVFDCHPPKLTRTPNIARRGSTNATGWPKLGLKRLSVAKASSALSLNAFSTSSRAGRRADRRQESR